MKKSPFFTGHHHLILDPKNRLSIPSVLRKGFDPADGGSLFLTLKDSILRLYTLGHFRRLIKRELGSSALPAELLQQYTYLVVSLGAEVECDTQGRVVLPDSVLARTPLGKKPATAREVTLVGAVDHMQLFLRETWTEMEAGVTGSRKLIESTVTSLLDKNAGRQPAVAPQTGATIGI